MLTARHHAALRYIMFISVSADDKVGDGHSSNESLQQVLDRVFGDDGLSLTAVVNGESLNAL